MDTSSALIAAGRKLTAELRPLLFSDPVSHTYLTTDYAAAGYEGYLARFGNSKKRVLFLGMNPGPFGMVQTGVPFGEVAMVRDWMKFSPENGKPASEHPKRPVTGMACTRSEVSGRRLWGLFAEKFPNPDDFFRDHLVVNFCPLVWMKDTGANLTPDKIKSAEMVEVDAACHRHLRRVIEILEPSFLIGVGVYAEKQMAAAAAEIGVEATVGKILHPSPASPLANRGWGEAAEKQLSDLGIW